MNSILTDIGRRAFVERFAKAFFGVSLLPASAAVRAAETKVGGKAKSVIFLYMRGGISHIDTFDPKPGKPEMGGVRAIATSADGVQISEWFPLMAKQMHHVALVRSMTSTQGIHDRGNYLAHTSYFMTPTITHPSLGSWVVKQIGSANAVLPGNILINGSPQHPRSGYMPTQLAPLPIVDPGAGLQNASLPPKTTESDFARRTGLAQALGSRFIQQTPHRDAAAYLKVQQDAAALMKSKELKVFDISLEDKEMQIAYGTHTFGKGCLLARRLVESGVRFIEVEDAHNWDTHNDQIKSMENMTPSTDQTMAVLLEDLHQRCSRAPWSSWRPSLGAHRKSATSPPGAGITPAYLLGGSPVEESKAATSMASPTRSANTLRRSLSRCLTLMRPSRKPWVSISNTSSTRPREGPSPWQTKASQ
ncbi:MAG: DUF1501 domain-containing protein [Planctomycetota bacterium]|nr:DUF1501 domain-containing protein [Planctomycetota bacterium]